MIGVTIWTISILLSGWFVLGGVGHVYPSPSILPAVAAIVWVVVLEATVILGYRSIKKDSFRGKKL